MKALHPVDKLSEYRPNAYAYGSVIGSRDSAVLVYTHRQDTGVGAFIRAVQSAS